MSAIPLEILAKLDIIQNLYIVNQIKDWLLEILMCRKYGGDGVEALLDRITGELRVLLFAKDEKGSNK